MKSHAICRKIECSLLSTEDIARKYPYIRTDDLQGGLFIPIDAVADPHAICEGLAELAAEQGVRLFEGIQVNRVLTSQNRVAAVETDRGTIKCDFFVNCAGFWARSLGKKTQPQVKVPRLTFGSWHLKFTSSLFIGKIGSSSGSGALLPSY